MIKLKGIAASSGIAIGKAHCVGRDEFSISSKTKITYEEMSREIYRLEEALIETRREIMSLQQRMSKDLGFVEAKIFEAHLLVLEDRVLIEDVIQRIKNQKVNVEYAFSQSIKKYIDTLLKLDDKYLRERVVDIEDISKRVLRKLLGQEKTMIDGLVEKAVIVAHDLSPSDTASLPKKNILGFITEVGGTTSHTVIIARSLSIPAVVGVEIAMQNIKEGETVIVDGTKGMVIVSPSKDVLRKYQLRSHDLLKEARTVHIPKAVKAITLDGHHLIVSANVELPEEIELVKRVGAEGIGLYRTEYLFLGRKELPSEHEQYKAYHSLAKMVKPHPAIIRTIDIGGDKFLSQPEVPREFTPFLGWRAIRFCLARPDVFKLQLRAILRASTEGNVKMMFPMISGLDELQQVKALLMECKRELKNEGKKFDENIAVGVMIEVPSAALTADLIAKESDFFSIGTNDLIQYSIAVDRADEKVAYLYEPAHLGVLRLIKNVIDAGHNNNIWVGMCGEMAGEALFAFLLLGMGIDELSMPLPSVPIVKEMIRKIKYTDAQKAVEEIFTMTSPKAIRIHLKEALQNLLKEEYQRIVGT